MGNTSKQKYMKKCTTEHERNANQGILKVCVKAIRIVIMKTRMLAKMEKKKTSTSLAWI